MRNRRQKITSNEKNWLFYLRYGKRYHGRTMHVPITRDWYKNNEQGN